MNIPAMPEDQVKELFKEIAFEMDEAIFMDRIQQAIDQGLDLAAPVPMGLAQKSQTVLDGLLVIADSKPRLELIRRHCNPLEGALHSTIKEGSSVAYALLQVAIENDTPGPRGEGLFEHILHAPIGQRNAAVLFAAYIAGADTDCSGDENWFQVFTRSPHAFPSVDATHFAEIDWECSWSVVEALLDMGFDPCAPRLAAPATIDAYRNLLDHAIGQPSEKTRRQLHAAFDAFELEQTADMACAVRSRARL